MPKMVRITINGKEYEAQEGTTVLEAARKEGIDIPTLCYHKALEPSGTCRLCIVEVSGSIWKSIRVSCIQEVNEGLVVETETEEIKRNRRLLLELLLGRCPDSNRLIDLAARYGVTGSRFHTGEIDDCVRCGLCVRVCRDKIGAYALCFSERGYGRHVTTEFEHLSQYCIGCGSCAQVCPTGAIRIEDRGNKRKIYMWDRVISKFDLEKCEGCGRSFLPQATLDHIKARLPEALGIEFNSICPECTSKIRTQEITGVIHRLC